MENKKIVPRRRFAGFTDAWEQRKLGDLTQIKTGASDTQDAINDGKYPFFVRSENIERSNNYLFDGEAILIPGEGRLGDIYHYINGKFNFHQRVYKISDFTDELYGKFLLYSMQRFFKKHALKYTVKATVDSLRLPMLTEFELLIPEIDEQVKIGKLFKDIDNLITLHQRKLEKMKNLKSAYLSEMFPAEGECKPKIRFAGFTDAWEQRKLSDVVSLFGGNAFSSQNSVDNGAKWLKIANVGTGQLKWNDESFLPTSYLNEFSSYRLKIGDYVMALTRPILNHELKIAEIAGDDILLNQRVAKLIFSGDAKFGYQMLRKSSTVDKIESELAGTDPPNLSANTLNHIDVRVPSLTEQIKIGIFFKSIDNLITLHQRKLEKLQNIKKAYLNEMFI